MVTRRLALIFCFLICFCLFVSCSGNTDNQTHELIKFDNCEITTYDETVVLMPTEKGPFPLPEEMIYARTKDRDCSGKKEEENLIRQYKTYFSALTMHDTEGCKRYTFKDAVSYHKRMFPNLSEQEIWEQYFRDTDKVGELTDLAAKQDWEIVACVPVFFDKVVSQDEVFISFGSTIFIDARDFALMPKKLEKCIAHSGNGGKNWEFITINSDSDGILSLSCENEIVSILTKSSNLEIK